MAFMAMVFVGEGEKGTKTGLELFTGWREKWIAP
jgi:hypothetical protein